MDRTHNITIEDRPQSPTPFRWACDCGLVGFWLSTRERAQEFGEFHIEGRKVKE